MFFSDEVLEVLDELRELLFDDDEKVLHIDVLYIRGGHDLHELLMVSSSSSQSFSLAIQSR